MVPRPVDGVWDKEPMGFTGGRHHPSTEVCGRWCHGLSTDSVLYNGHDKEPMEHTGVPSPSVIGGVRALVPRPVDGSRVLYNGHGKEPMEHTGVPSPSVIGGVRALVPRPADGSLVLYNTTVTGQRGVRPWGFALSDLTGRTTANAVAAGTLRLTPGPSGDLRAGCSSLVCPLWSFVGLICSSSPGVSRSIICWSKWKTAIC